MCSLSVLCKCECVNCCNLVHRAFMVSELDFLIKRRHLKTLIESSQEKLGLGDKLIVVYFLHEIWRKVYQIKKKGHVLQCDNVIWNFRAEKKNLAVAQQFQLTCSLPFGIELLFLGCMWEIWIVKGVLRLGSNRTRVAIKDEVWDLCLWLEKRVLASIHGFTYKYS